MEKKSALKLTTKMHTGYGIASFVLGLISIVCFLIAVGISASVDRSGQGAQVRIGMVEIIGILFNLVGLPMAIMGELSKETFKLYAHIGLAINAIAVAFHVAVLIFGY